MALNAKEAFSMVKQSAKDFGDDDCPRLAAALAYYIVFALPPLLILIMKIVGTFVSQEQVQSALSGQFGQMIGSDGAKTVQTMIASAKQPGGGVLSTVLGIAALVLGATGAFMQLQSALDRAWEVKTIETKFGPVTYKSHADHALINRHGYSFPLPPHPFRQ